MSKNYNTNESLKTFERPPLPPKNMFKSAPPLPPKLAKCKEDFQKLGKLKLPNQKKPSSNDLIINNNSYSLSNINENICIKEEKVLEKKEVYENYDLNIETPLIKKKSIVNKMKKFLKKSKKASQSIVSDDLSNHVSLVVDNNKYNEIPDVSCNNNWSDFSICNQCCTPCHCFQHHHHYHHHHHHHHYHHHHHHHHHHHYSFHHLKCNISANILSQLSPIVPNRIRTEAPSEISSPQLNIEELELKALVPIRPSPMEKYSKNFLNKNLTDLKKVGWYWGSLSSAEAERVMTDQPDGTFLVRDSAHSDHLFSVTFRVNYLTYHARIQFSQNKFWWNRNNQDDGFESIIDLIKNSMDISERGECRYFENTENINVPPYAVSLLKPLSRFKMMSSLKHLARFVIISNVRSDHLQQLPLPLHLLSYLFDKEHHYIEDFDRYLNTIDHQYQYHEDQSIG